MLVYISLLLKLPPADNAFAKTIESLDHLLNINHVIPIKNEIIDCINTT